MDHEQLCLWIRDEREMKPILETKSMVFNHMITYPDLQIFSGQATFITGASGSGKSTLLKLFNGVLSPSEGALYYDGADIAALDTVKLRREVLLAGQSVFLFEGSIRENFGRYYAYRDLPMPSEEAIQEVLKTCCLDFPLTKDCLTMSGGERHRAFIAVCLSFGSKVLLVDEPTAALDEKNAALLIGSLAKHCNSHGMTLVIVCHDKALTSQFSEKTIVIGGAV